MGGDWPDGAKNTMGPRSVLLAAAEDDRNDTVIPRLMAAGADLSRITFLDELTVRDYSEENSSEETRQLQLSEDVNKLRQLLAAYPDVALIVVDTITSYFGEVNTNMDKEVRPIMDALGKAFRDCKACFLGIVHLNERSDTDAIGKILGASSIAGAVRAAWSVNRDPDNKDQRFFTEIKNNLSKEQNGMKFTTDDKEVSPGIKGSYITWLGACDETADDVLAKERDQAKERKENPAVTAARLFLKARLERGERRARELFTEAEAEGISSWHLRRAQQELGVVVYQKQQASWWSFPAGPDDKQIENEEVL